MTNTVSGVADPANHPTRDLVTVLGGTGGIGRAIVEQLLARDQTGPQDNRIRAVSRSATTDGGLPAGVELADADLMDPRQALDACAGSAVVVMAAQPPYTEWLANWPTMLDNVIAGTTAAGARLVFVDNLYAYAPASGTLTEASPEHATDPKGALRARLGQRILAAHRDGEVRAVVGRFSDYFGPGGDNSGLTMTGLRPGSAGKTMRGMVDLDQPHAYHYLPDAARGFVAMVENPTGDGRIWLLPTHPAMTQRQMLQQVNTLLPTPVRIGRFGPRIMWLAGLFDAMLKETRSVVVQFDRPWEVDGAAFEATFGSLPLTPVGQALQETLDWLATDPTGGDLTTSGADRQAVVGT